MWTVYQPTDYNFISTNRIQLYTIKNDSQIRVFPVMWLYMLFLIVRTIFIPVTHNDSHML